MYGDEERAKTLTNTAVFAALITAGGWLSIPLFAVPFTLQTLFLLLASAVMKERAAFPALLYAAAGLIGLPVFHNGTAGLAVILGPTGGFILGFIPAAYLAGLFFRKQQDAAAVISATVVCAVCGTLWFMLTSGASLPAALLACVVPYIAGDTLKGIAAVAAAKRIRRIQND